ncbi:hypothetical protein B0T17DRAFT_506331 [Bombardia bombarda]|uniref:Uncharacterized protein n=1 Tax=Bombardia bombarda TaxID=252184 RepID=A0AA40C9B1_9PEZI|nr:hypothetical protein B0T17DRAFT_506331 [Bombardia bombarda]
MYGRTTNAETLVETIEKGKVSNHVSGLVIPPNSRLPSLPTMNQRHEQSGPRRDGRTAGVTWGKRRDDMRGSLGSLVNTIGSLSRDIKPRSRRGEAMSLATTSRRGVDNLNWSTTYARPGLGRYATLEPESEVGTHKAQVQQGLLGDAGPGNLLCKGPVRGVWGPGDGDEVKLSFNDCGGTTGGPDFSSTLQHVPNIEEALSTAEAPQYLPVISRLPEIGLDLAICCSRYFVTRHWAGGRQMTDWLVHGSKAAATAGEWAISLTRLYLNNQIGRSSRHAVWR